MLAATKTAEVDAYLLMYSDIHLLLEAVRWLRYRAPSVRNSIFIHHSLTYSLSMVAIFVGYLTMFQISNLSLSIQSNWCIKGPMPATFKSL